MALRLITPPAVEPLTLAECKQHCRVDSDDQDAILALYLGAARARVDGPYGFLARALVTQTWELVIDAFPQRDIKIPLPPLQEVESVMYDDGDGVEQTLATSEYTVDTVNEPGWILPTTSWPATFDAINSVRIRFVAGYAPAQGSPADLAANVPPDIKSAILLDVGARFEHRENIIAGVSITKLPDAWEALLRPYRIHVAMA